MRTPTNGVTFGNMESIHDYVLQQLQKTKGHWPQVARESGVPARTLEKIAREEIPNPGVKHVERLARYFSSKAFISRFLSKAS